MRKLRALLCVGGGVCMGATFACSDAPVVGRTSGAARELPVPVVFRSDSLGGEIRDISLGTDVWVTNRGEPSVAEYGRDGHVIWHGVTKGEGPDQAYTVWGVAASGDTGFVWDPITRRLSRIVNGVVTPEAIFDFQSTHYIAGLPHAVVVGSAGRLRSWTGGWVTYATESEQWSSAHLRDMVILRFARDGKVIDTIADLRRKGVPAMMEAQKSRPVDLVPAPLWDVCPRDRFVLFDPGTQELSWGDVGSRSRDSLHLEFTPVEIPEAFQRAHLLWQFQIAGMGRVSEDTLKAYVEAGFEHERPRIGRETYFATSLFCDASGSVWMQRFSLDAPPKGFSTEWTVIDPTTKAMTTAMFPKGFQPKAADSTLVFGVVEDEDGVQSVATVPRAGVLQAVGRR